MKMRTRVVQLFLTFLLLLASSVITGGLGHGGIYLGLLPFLSPWYAVTTLLIAAVLLFLAWKTAPGAFTIVATVYAGVLLVPAGLMLMFDGPVLIVGATVLPLLTVWIGVVVRGALIVWRGRSSNTGV